MGSSANLYSPLMSVTAVVSPMSSAGLEAVILTPGTEAPVSSVTRPRTLALVMAWPNAEAARRIVNHTGVHLDRSDSNPDIVEPRFRLPIGRRNRKVARGRVATSRPVLWVQTLREFNHRVGRRQRSSCNKMYQTKAAAVRSQQG